ncbi:MAG: hypothetical protein AABX10_02435 [Nanoarchaeota archaeon]
MKISESLVNYFLGEDIRKDIKFEEAELTLSGSIREDEKAKKSRNEILFYSSTLPNLLNSSLIALATLYPMFLAGIPVVELGRSISRDIADICFANIRSSRIQLETKAKDYINANGVYTE